MNIEDFKTLWTATCGIAVKFGDGVIAPIRREVRKEIRERWFLPDRLYNILVVYYYDVIRNHFYRITVEMPADIPISSFYTHKRHFNKYYKTFKRVRQTLSSELADLTTYLDKDDFGIVKLQNQQHYELVAVKFLKLTPKLNMSFKLLYDNVEDKLFGLLTTHYNSLKDGFVEFYITNNVLPLLEFEDI